MPSAESLQRITDAALAYLDLDDLLQEILERVAAILRTDTAAILLLDEETNELVARAAKGIEEEVEQQVRIPMGAGFAGRVAAERRPVAVKVSPETVVNPLLIQKGIKSLLGVPLIVEGTLVGVLHVGALTHREFAPTEEGLLQVAADRLALAIDHARLYESERKARAELEQLQSVTEAALAYLDLDDLLNELLERATAILHTDTAAILLLEEEAGELVARAAKGIEEEVEQGVRIPLGKGFAGGIAAARRPLTVVPSPETVVNPLLIEKGIKTLLGVPLVVERRLIGVLHVGSLTPRTFTAADERLLQLVGDRAALAIEHDRLFEQYRIAATLQRSLLPERMPELPGVALAARYFPASTPSTVGGDWYDVIPLADGRVGVAIGDVLGRGVDAAALMGQLRTALRAYALESDSASDTAARLSRFAATLEPGQMATMLYALVDPEKGRATVVSAAHPVPLLVRPDGSTRFIELVPEPPLGTGGPGVFSEAEIELEPGATLLLYTDGLVERRGERLAAGQAALARAAGNATFDPELLCAEVCSELVGDADNRDDVAVIAVQAVGASDARLELQVAARPDELAAVRRLLRRWLRAAGMAPRDTSAVLVAVGEACTNAVEHAYGPGDAVFELVVERSEDEVVIEVRDHGTWREPRGANRGRGIGLMEMFMDEVALDRGEAGTTVRLVKRLGNAVPA